jgi:hypothetical protein
MDDNRITSTDFDYDAYTGGSTSFDDDVTSGDFNYDVYSGSNAMEYLRQENERKAEERKRAQKTEAELRREEYEKRFAGMSADELFAMPEKKKQEDDFSDFFDADEIQRQREYMKRYEQEKIPKPKVESMMPGEDTPSSEAPHNEKYAQGMQTAAEMMAHGRIRRELDDEHYREYRRSRYYGGYSRDIRFISSLFGLGSRSYYHYRRYGETTEFDKALSWYFVWFLVGALLGGFFFGAVHIGLIILSGAFSGAVGAVIRRNGIQKMPIGEAIASSRLELIGIAIAAIVGLIIELA